MGGPQNGDFTVQLARVTWSVIKNAAPSNKDESASGLFGEN